MTNADEAAFTLEDKFHGLTKREYIATHILAALSVPVNGGTVAGTKHSAGEAIHRANELLKQLEEYVK